MASIASLELACEKALGLGAWGFFGVGEEKERRTQELACRLFSYQTAYRSYRVI